MFPENHSGIIWVLGCAIILTLSGVLLSMLVDKRLDHSSETNSIRAKLESDENIIQDLRKALADESGKMESRVITAEKMRSDHESAKASLNRISGELISLRKRKEELTLAIPDTQKQFERYRSDYRARVWRDAAGEKIESIFLNTGRVFEKVIITRVTDFGLEISHSNGNARIDFKDLGSDYRNRFQWDDTGRQAIIEKERVNHARLTKGNTPVRVTEPTKTPGDALPTPGLEEHSLIQLQTRVRALKIRVSSLSNSLSNAHSQSRYGKQRSVPGTLRTWEEQVGILERDMTKSRTQLSLAMEQLRLVSPQDPLLLPEPVGSRR